MSNIESNIELNQDKIIAFIANKINQSNIHAIPFSQFMEYALYTPDLGYYSQSNIRIGSAGDFTTAPEISPLFGQTVAQAITCDTILELGAGSGKLAAQIIHAIQPKNYFILERSAFLRTQQQAYLQQNNIHNVIWLDELPQQFNGCILGNEVLDAIAVDIWHYDYQAQKWYAKYVTCTTDNADNADDKTNKTNFKWINIDIQKHIPAEYIPKVILDIDISNDNAIHQNAAYITESHIQTEQLLTTLCNIQHTGQMIWIDYGYPAHIYYHPQRNMGTLMCYHKHRGHDNAFINIGAQDISVHVNFSLVQDVLMQQSYNIDYFDTQARFLLDYGILDELNSWVAKNEYTIGDKNYIKASSQIQTLLSDAEMGQIFKVCIASKP
jgi:SAM-dependent MidA family methyltransferase